MKIESTYARAFDQIIRDSSEDNGSFEEVYSQLFGFNQSLVGSPEISKFFSSPIIPVLEKTKVIESVFSQIKFCTNAKSFVRVLAENGRLDHLGGVLHELKRINVEKRGGTLADLVSAYPLSEEMLLEITRIFKKKLNKEIEFVQSEDKALIAGFKARIDGVTYDASMLGELESLKQSLTDNELWRKHAN